MDNDNRIYKEEHRQLQSFGSVALSAGNSFLESLSYSRPIRTAAKAAASALFPVSPSSSMGKTCEFGIRPVFGI
jgi:hypothetical protein